MLREGARAGAAGWLLRTCMAWLFLLTAGPACLFFALTVPPGQVPDEAAHVVRAASIARLQLLGHKERKPDGAGRMLETVTLGADPALVENAFFFAGDEGVARKVTAESLARFFDKAWRGTAFDFPVPNTAQYFPLLYVPAGVAVAAVKVLRMRPWAAIAGGRLANAVAYLALGVSALLVARRGQVLIFATLCLPISLFLAASFSQDGLLIATAALAVALLGRHLDRPGQPGRSYWWGCGLLAVVCLAKPLYLPLALLTLLPLPFGAHAASGRAWRQRALGLALAVVPGLAWAAVVARFVATVFWFPDYAPGPLYDGDPGTVFGSSSPPDQVRILLAQPFRLLAMPLASLAADLPALTLELVGVLGLIELALPKWLYGLWYCALAAALLGDALGRAGRGWQPRPLETALLLLALAAIVWGIYVVQYVTWTEVGQARIRGVQGRYFVPLLPALALLLPAIRLPGVGVAARMACLVPAACGLVVLPSLVIIRYLVR